MEETSERVPIVLIDHDPPRHMRWPWGVLAGALLAAGLATALLQQQRSPSAAPPPPPPESATEIAFVVEPAPPKEEPERPIVPVEQIVEVLPVPPVPLPDLPKTEVVPVKAEAPPASPPPPPPPPPAETEVVERRFAAAAAALRDAEPLFREVAEGFPSGDPRDLSARLDRVENLLIEARDAYVALRDRAPDPALVTRRLSVLDELLESLQRGRSRIRVPFALKQAEALHREAALLAKEALDGFQPYSREAYALDVKAEVAAGKLREACRLWASIRTDAPVDRRIRRSEALLDRLEKRFPSIQAR